MTTTEDSAQRDSRIAGLYRERERHPYLRWSAAVMGGLIVWAWTTGDQLTGRLPAERRWINFKNFVSELVPAPVRNTGDWSEAFPWAWDLLTEKGGAALLMTLGIATAAIILSAVFVTPFLAMASRELARPDPCGVWPGKVSGFSRRLWHLTGAVTRFGFVLARAVPEYIVAFLLISLLGIQAWPLVLALAIHNFGILGRLWGEVVENADPAAARVAISAGSGRLKVFGAVIMPAQFSRFLIYFFYRWETCTKDATVLGMLGLLTLGHLIALAKGFFWDQMFFYILLGASVILVGDLLSAAVRRWLRQ